MNDIISPEVEAKARELCIADGKDPDRDWRVGESTTMSCADPHPENWRRYVKAARALGDDMGPLGGNEGDGNG